MTFRRSPKLIYIPTAEDILAMWLRAGVADFSGAARSKPLSSVEIDKPQPTEPVRFGPFKATRWDCLHSVYIQRSSQRNNSEILRYYLEPPRRIRTDDKIKETGAGLRDSTRVHPPTARARTCRLRDFGCGDNGRR